MNAAGTPKAKVRAACYCRISSDPNDKREGVDRQREDTTTLCEVKGWRVVEYYVDNDRSASNGKKRPEWERLLADIRAGKIDAVAAWDQDRVNRMMDDFVSYKKLFVERGVLLATSNNGDIDLSTPSGVLTATIKTAVSEHEVAMMRVRQCRAALAKAETGRPQWKRAFGYKPDTRPKGEDDGTRKIDKAQAALVRKAYRAVLAGGSLNDVARLFNDAGQYGLNGRPWTASTVSLFMRKPRNAGLRDHNDELVLDKDGQPVKGTWPPLVTVPLWRSVLCVLNAPGRAPGRKTVKRHLLTGVLLCGAQDCDGYLSGMHTPKDRHGNTTITYACKKCRGVSVRAEHIEPHVYGIIAGRLAKPDAVTLLRAELHDAAEAERLRTEAATLRERLLAIADDRADGLLDGAQAKRASDRIRVKLEAIERQQQDAERLRVFDGIPLGQPQVAAAIKRLTPDRFRAVMAVLLTVTIAPVGKGGHTYRPERVQVRWQ